MQLFMDTNLFLHTIISIIQELLGRQLSFKREMEVMKDRLSHSERELVRVASTARLHREDKVGNYILIY